MIGEGFNMKDDILEDLSTEEMEDIVEHINRVCGNFWIDLTEEYIAFHQNKDMDIKDKFNKFIDEFGILQDKMSKNIILKLEEHAK